MPHTPDFDTTPFQAQYQWLGADARQKLLDFIADCEKDSSAQVNVFAYDLDEPDIIAAICRLRQTRSAEGNPGQRVVALQVGRARDRRGEDDHRRSRPAQREARATSPAIQHNKVFIKRDHAGNAQNVHLRLDEFFRARHLRAGEQRRRGRRSERRRHVRQGLRRCVPEQRQGGAVSGGSDLQGLHGRLGDGHRGAAKILASLVAAHELHRLARPDGGPYPQGDSSVLFAVMEPTGGGPVLASLRTIAAQPTVFSYGTVETNKGLAVQSPDGEMGIMTSFAALTKNVPEPFKKEFDGGAGMHIHDKFVVVDFNAANPTVFTGSSNLAAGGEQANGDSLAMIEDAAIANMFAIEAMALFDHFHFRKVMQQVTVKEPPLTLWYPGKPNAPDPWWKAYYDPKRIQMRDRYLFAALPLPAGLATTKNVDWSAIDAAAPASKKTAKQAPSGGAKKTPASPRRHLPRSLPPRKPHRRHLPRSPLPRSPPVPPRRRRPRRRWRRRPGNHPSARRPGRPRSKRKRPRGKQRREKRRPRVRRALRRRRPRSGRAGVSPSRMGLQQQYRHGWIARPFVPEFHGRAGR